MKVATKSPNGKVTETADKPETLQEKHARLVQQWHKTTAASRARVGSAITDTELELEIQGVEYEPFVRPIAWAQKWTMAEDELVERIAKVKALAGDSSKRDVIRSKAETELGRLLKQAGRRG